MGVSDLRKIFPEGVIKEIDMKGLLGKVVAIDAFNALYQFLTTIRQPDGTPLMDRQGRITSHLSGLFYRTGNLVEMGIKPVYVFDGEPPPFKRKEIEERVERKEEAERKYMEALRAGRIEEARKYASMASRLTSEMIEDAKRLLDALGIPYVQAPSEGEAQAAYMAKKGDVYASVSQDYDSLLFGSPRLIRNLTITGKRKVPGKKVYVEIKPELIILEKVLSALKISREQLVDIAILIGTDYNEGIEGVGPKKAYEIVRSAGDIEKAMKALGVKYDDVLLEIREFFLNPPVTDDYTLKWRMPNEDKVVEILCEEHDFSKERVLNNLQKYRSVKARQMTLF
ncbi:MAG: flap endonuclease-1 [Thermoplasmata archaeon]|nr:MAG: flap endonuclease-1 [Thermoplasmata archaeon]